MQINSIRLGVFIGMFLAVAHAARAILVALNWAQPLMNCVFLGQLHHAPYHVEPLNMMRAIMLVGLVFVVGLVFGTGGPYPEEACKHRLIIRPGYQYMALHHESNGNEHFSSALLSIAGTDHAERVSLQAVVEFLGNGAIGSLLLFFALPIVLPIPAPGISVVFGLPLILISAQLLFGRRSLWLPPWLANRTVSRSTLEVYVRRALPTVRKFEKFVRPRFANLTRGLSLMVLGAMCLILAVIIALPVPLGHLVPGAAISVMSLGLIERDRLAVLAGFLIGVMALLIVTFATIGLIAAKQNFF